MQKKNISIFVDESGNFGDIKDSPRYCMVTFVLQDDESSYTELYKEYSNAIFRLGVDPEAMVFHTAPLIRQEDQFSAMSRNMRGKIFYQMLSFVRKSNIRFSSFVVDTKFVTSTDQIVADLQSQIADFLRLHSDYFADKENVSLYYDAGQKGVTKILSVLQDSLPCRIDVVPGVKQSKYFLLQVADFLCTLELIAHRLANGLELNMSEKRFLGSARDFKRNVLRKILDKRIG